MKVIQEKESPLLERKTLILEIEYPKAPPLSRPDVKKKIAEKFKVNENLIAIQKIKTRFGGKYLKIICNIYKNKELLKKLEKPKKKDQTSQETKEEIKEKPKKKDQTPQENKEELKKNVKETKKAA